MNYKDVELLNGALDQISDSLLKRRMMEQQATERAAQTGLQRQRLNVDSERWNATQAHQKRLEEKADQGNQLLRTRADIQDKQAMLENLIKLNAGGQINDLDAVNEWLANDEHFGKTGLQLTEPKQKADPQAGQNAIAQAYQQADSWRKKAADAVMLDPDNAVRWSEYADRLESWGNLQTSEKPAKPVKIGERAVDPTNPGAGKTYEFGQPGASGAGVSPLEPDFVLDPKTKKLVKNPRKAAAQPKP